MSNQKPCFTFVICFFHIVPYDNSNADFSSFLFVQGQVIYYLQLLTTFLGLRSSMHKLVSAESVEVLGTPVRPLHHSTPVSSRHHLPARWLLIVPDMGLTAKGQITGASGAGTRVGQLVASALLQNSTCLAGPPGHQPAGSAALQSLRAVVSLMWSEWLDLPVTCST